MKKTFRSALEIIPCGVVLIDSDTEEIMYANNEIVNMMKGETQEEKDILEKLKFQM